MSTKIQKLLWVYNLKVLSGIIKKLNIAENSKRD